MNFPKNEARKQILKNNKQLFLAIKNHYI